GTPCPYTTLFRSWGRATYGGHPTCVSYDIGTYQRCGATLSSFCTDGVPSRSVRAHPGEGRQPSSWVRTACTVASSHGMVPAATVTRGSQRSAPSSPSSDCCGRLAWPGAAHTTAYPYTRPTASAGGVAGTSLS